MSRSLKYNGIDLSAYGLTIMESGAALAALLSAELSQGQDRAYASNLIAPPKSLPLDVIIEAVDQATLISYLDSIKRICAQREPKQLILDIMDDRYWTARFEHLTGQYLSPCVFRGELLFSADDPLAYDVSETSSDFNVDADPKTVTETVGGTGYVKPLFTLTAGEELSDITLLVENTDTGEELQWEGSLSNGEVLTIDSARCIVEKEGVADMATVSGQFPRLLPGENNHIKITGFGSLGSLNITYRNAYF
jgi:phage-related protein